MTIMVFQSIHKQNHMDKTEIGRSSKYRVGCKPATMSSRVVLSNIRGKINRAWKNDVARAYRKAGHAIRKDVHCTVRTDFGVFELVPRDPESFANRLANLILLATRNHSMEYGEIKRDAIPTYGKALEKKSVKPKTK